jgi:uncharacterized membrane protein
LQAEQDYQVNLKAELEVAQLHRKLDHLHERLEEYWERSATPPREDHAAGNPRQKQRQ